MAEWLRRWTRNPLGYPRAGSNPARDDPSIPLLPVFFRVSQFMAIDPDKALCAHKHPEI